MHGLMQRHQLADFLRPGTCRPPSWRRRSGQPPCRRALSRTTYAALAPRARKLADVLRGLGVKHGDRVGTIGMNSDRHLELYYGVCGSGAVCNTINPRLSPDDIAYIAEHAGDALIFCDPAFLPIIAAIAPKLEILRAVVVLCDAAAMPQADCPPIAPALL